MSGAEIAGLIAAGAFVVLVIFLSIVLVRVNKVMKNVQKTVDSVDQSVQSVTKDVNALSGEVEELLTKSNSLLADINQKVVTLDPVFKAMGEVGTSVSDLNQSSRQLANRITSVGGNLAKARLSTRILSSIFSHHQR